MAKKQSKNPAAGAAPQKKAPLAVPVRQETNRKFSLNLQLAVLLGLISFVAYANSLRNGYVLDDCSVTTSNTIISKGISAIPEILSTPYRKGFLMTTNDLYRPLSLVMFATEYQFFGLNSHVFHFFNIIIFAGCVILLFLFLDRLFGRKKTAVAFISALLFALHPIHTEVVANIKSADELLCFFFAFLSLNIFIKYYESGKITQLLLGTFCFFLSFLSKETVVTFLAVFPFIFFFYMSGNKKRGLYITVCAALTAIIVLAIRFSVLDYYHANVASDIAFIDNPLAKTGLPAESRLATALLILGDYAKLLFIPYPLVWDYSFSAIQFVHFSDLWVLISLLFYISIGVLGVRRVLKNHKDPYAFGILFFLVTLSLFSNIPFLIGSAMGERFLFFPSVGFCLVIALLVEKLAGSTTDTNLATLKNPKVLAALIPVCLACIFITINRNSEWLDNYTLYRSDVKKLPNVAKLNYFMGYELETTTYDNEKDPAKKAQDREESISYFKKALAIYPEYSNAEANLGYVYYCNSLFDSAAVHDKRTIGLDPGNFTAITNLAAIYNKQKNYPQAIQLYKKAIELSPGVVSDYTYAGLCYGSSGMFDSAIYYCNKAVSIDPAFTPSYEILATTYKLKGNPDSAKKYEALAGKK